MCLEYITWKYWRYSQYRFAFMWFTSQNDEKNLEDDIKVNLLLIEYPMNNKLKQTWFYKFKIYFWTWKLSSLASSSLIRLDWSLRFSICVLNSSIFLFVSRKSCSRSSSNCSRKVAIKFSDSSFFELSAYTTFIQ